MGDDASKFGLGKAWGEAMGADHALALIDKERVASEISRIAKAFEAYPGVAAFRVSAPRPAPLAVELRWEGDPDAAAEAAFCAAFHSAERQRDFKLRAKAIQAGWLARADRAGLAQALGFMDLAAGAESHSIEQALSAPEAAAAPRKPRSL